MARRVTKTKWEYKNGRVIDPESVSEKSRLFEKMVSALDEKDLVFLRHHIQKREIQLASQSRSSTWSPALGGDT